MRSLSKSLHTAIACCGPQIRLPGLLQDSITSAFHIISIDERHASCKPITESPEEGRSYVRRMAGKQDTANKGCMVLI